MTLGEILAAKGHAVHTISSNATLDDVVHTLVRHNCGSLVVCDGEIRCGETRDTGHMIGIITERDILKACAAHDGALANLRVRDAMTTNVTTGDPADSVEETMGLMTRMRIRHLPVIEHGQLQGLISIGDVVKCQYDQLSMENHYLKTYING